MFNEREKRAVFAIAGIYGLRMMGLFLILPVFAMYAESLKDVNPTLVGLALGAYGFTMAVFQIPFGWLSDKLGRKPVIAGGLLIFAAGSVVAAISDSIWGVIVGRALQGAGAIAAALTALLADLTREEVRLRSMAVIGMTIGFSFTIALVLGPWVDALIGVPGIFWATAVLALVSIFVLYRIVPTPERTLAHRDAEARAGDFGRILRDRQLLRLDFGIMALHGVMTAMFVALPFVLRDQLHIAPVHHAWVYLPVLVVAMGLMVPLIIMAEKKGKMRQVFLGAIAGVLLSGVMLGAMHTGLAQVVAGLFVFFVSYNVLEATLPSLISRMAPIDAKGTAMGIYSSSQFLGAFLGGALGGWAMGTLGASGVFYGCALVMLLWLALALGMRMPAMRSAHMMHVDGARVVSVEALEQQLLALDGVYEARVVPEEDAVFLRIDKQQFDEQQARALLAQAEDGSEHG